MLVAKFHAQKVPNALLRFMSNGISQKESPGGAKATRPASPAWANCDVDSARCSTQLRRLASQPRGIGGQIASSARLPLPPPLLLMPLLNVQLSQSVHAASFGRGTIQCRLRPLSRGIKGRRGRLIQAIRSFFPLCNVRYSPLLIS